MCLIYAVFANTLSIVLDSNRHLRQLEKGLAMEEKRNTRRASSLSPMQERILQAIPCAAASITTLRVHPEAPPIRIMGSLLGVSGIDFGRLSQKLIIGILILSMDDYLKRS